MKALILIITAIFIFSSCENKQANKDVNSDQSDEINNTDSLKYDAELAQKYGADEYGMKSYVLAYLKRGPNRDQDSATAEKLQRAHLDNIMRMAKKGKLVLAGPFLDDGDVRGIYIFNVKTVEEAEALTKSDPAVQAGRLVMELHPWYGSAALIEITHLHKKIAKQNP